MPALAHTCIPSTPTALPLHSCLCCLQLVGLVFEGLKQPVINGYLVAGAIVGPGGLQLIKELVQVGGWAQLWDEGQLASFA